MARGISQEAQFSVRVLDAARPGLHRAQVVLLAQSRDRAVRQTIARRDDVPLGVQAALAQDDAAEVRAAVAANVHTMRAVLDCLSADKNKAVLAALLANPCVPFEIVDRLAVHRRTEVRQIAIARLNLGERVPHIEAFQAQEEDARFPELRERAGVNVPAPAIAANALVAS